MRDMRKVLMLYNFPRGGKSTASRELLLTIHLEKVAIYNLARDP